MCTKNFKIKTENIVRNNVTYGNTEWGIAIDIGYSSVKGMSPNSVFRFPSYARKIDGDTLSFVQSSEDDILYRNPSTGQVWAVGECALKMISSADTQDSNSVLYGRNRYSSDMFRVIADVALAFGMQNNSSGSVNGRNILVQTGLPAAYLKTDSEYLTEVLEGQHIFDIKIGKKPWEQKNFSLLKSQISIMNQPLGSLISATTNSDGRKSELYEKVLKSKVLVFDPGFGTFDTFYLNGKTSQHETFDEFGMKAVFQKTVNKIFEKYGKEISVTALQTMLEEGTFKHFDKKTRSSQIIDFEGLLKEASEEVFMGAIEKAEQIYNHFEDLDYLIITGGTGEAWISKIYDLYTNMETLTILPGNINDNLPFVYSNVRGYYMMLQGRIRDRANKAAKKG